MLAERTSTNAAAQKPGRTGFTIVEVMIVMFIISLLASIAIPAFTKYTKRSRTAEVPGLLNKLFAGSVTYYTADRSAGGGAADKQFPGAGTSAPREAAAECGCLPGQVCPGSSAVWTDPIWSALQFGLGDPHKYMPGYQSQGVGTNANFTATATGDLDCDGLESTFQRLGSVNASTSDVWGAPSIFVVNEVE